MISASTVVTASAPARFRRSALAGLFAYPMTATPARRPASTSDGMYCPSGLVGRGDEVGGSWRRPCGADGECFEPGQLVRARSATP